jgi:hypothetical protein
MSRLEFRGQTADILLKHRDLLLERRDPQIRMHGLDRLGDADRNGLNAARDRIVGRGGLPQGLMPDFSRK